MFKAGDLVRRTNSPTGQFPAGEAHRVASIAGIGWLAFQEYPGEYNPEYFDLVEEAETPEGPTPAYYNHEYKGIKLDPYRVFDVYGITNACQQHAIKKLLRMGKGHKPAEQDIQEVIDTLTRWQEMMGEDEGGD